MTLVIHIPVWCLWTLAAMAVLACVGVVGRVCGWNEEKNHLV